MENPSGPFGGFPVRHFDVRQGAGLSAIGNQDVHHSEQLFRKSRCGCRIQKYLHSGFVSDTGRADDGFERNFELHDDEIGRLDLGTGLFDVGRQKGVVGPRSDGDTVFTFGIDGNQGHARRNFGIAEHEGRVDTLLSVSLFGPPGEQIVSGFADESDTAAQTGRSNGLIGPLPSRIHQESATQHSFSGGRQFLGLDDHVRVAATDDNNFFKVHFEVF